VTGPRVDPFADLGPGTPKNQTLTAPSDPFADLPGAQSSGDPFGDLPTTRSASTYGPANVPRMVGATAAAPPPPLQMPGVTVTEPEAPAAPKSATQAAIEARYGPISPPTPDSSFVTRVAQALASPVVDPIGVAKGMAQPFVTAATAAAQEDVRSAVAMTGGDLATVPPDEVSPKQAAISAAQIAAMLLAPGASRALGPILAPAVGSGAAGVLAEAIPAAGVGMALMPNDPVVGAVTGGIAGGAHAAIEGSRPTVTREITRNPDQMLPERATRPPAQGTGRVLLSDAPPVAPDFEVSDLNAPPPEPTRGTRGPLEELDAKDREAHAEELRRANANGPRGPEEVARDFEQRQRELAGEQEPEPVGAGVATEAPPQAEPPKIDDKVVLEDGVKRFRLARTPAGARRPVARVSTDGLIDEYRDMIAKRDDAVNRSQYRPTENDRLETIMVADRQGGGVSKQAKALQNLEDYTRIIGQLETELKNRGIEGDDLNDRLVASMEIQAERDGFTEKGIRPGDVNRDVITDENGNELFTPKKRTKMVPSGEKDLFGQDIMHEVPDEPPPPSLDQLNRPISAEEMAQRRDELGAERQAIPGADDERQGEMFREGGEPKQPRMKPSDMPVFARDHELLQWFESQATAADACARSSDVEPIGRAVEQDVRRYTACARAARLPNAELTMIRSAISCRTCAPAPAPWARASTRVCSRSSARTCTRAISASSR
jgi:hypothetical protein